MIDFRRRVRGADPDNRIRGIGAGQGPAEQRRAAIIDIGSNSVRLVVYAGPARAPTPVFNEKLMVGLGSGLASSGSIEPKPYRRAMAGLARFKALTEAMEIRDLRCVATAAVRDASNGAQFLTEARALGLSIDLLSGEDEARAAGYGVISAIPDADGIVADLGGGSLELVRVKDGATAHHSSFPLGVLRLAKLRGAHGARFGKAVARMIAEAGWPNGDSGLPLYLVGGSWRALARYDMIMARDPMPVVSGHVMPVAAAARLARRLRHADPAALALQPGLSSARTSTMADASALLVPLVAQLGSNRLIVSTSGLREGLLFQSLSPAIRAEDPLIAAAEAEGRRFARFAPHGRDIDRWIAPLFPDDDDAAARLRLAACLLSDVASTANPDFRDERAAEMALHGQWLGIDLADRMVLAETLFVSTGGQGRPFTAPADAMLEQRLLRAVQWGSAIRLAQRLSGGAARPLSESRLERDTGGLRLILSQRSENLGGEQVAKRLKQLADTLGVAAETVVD
jgi:exopolyphosphatase / guanosine-5'-triphosphate,3'-diphosphate pyrophosphatase